MKHTIIILFLTLALHAGAKPPFYTLKPASKLVVVETVTDSVSHEEVTEEDMKNEGESVLDSISALKDEAVKRYFSVCLPLDSIYETSGFGKRKNPFNKNKAETHKGIDLRCNNARVYSMMYGTVEKTGRDNRSGNYVVLRHGDYTVSYCHLESINCKKGDIVSAGQCVGVSGSTGRSTGPHLHLTIKFQGHHIDPDIVIGWIMNVRNKAKADLVSILYKEMSRGKEM